METKSLSYNNSNISYRVAGQGKPVMLLHGFGEDSSIWDEIIDTLGGSYLLIIPDVPGSGHSSLLQGNSIGIPAYGDAMLAVLDEENIAAAALVGHSMGGYISLAMAKKSPERLTGLVLYHSSAYADDDAKKETRRKAIAVIKEKGSMSFLKTAIPGLFFDAEKNKADIEVLLGKGEAFSPEALVQYYEAMISREDTTDVLRSIQKPVGFIMGEHDKAVPFEHSLQQSYLPSIAAIHIMRNSAHMSMLEEKQQSFAALEELLSIIYV